MAECMECGEDFSDKRAELGYKICLECGAKEAKKQAIIKSKRIAPLFNKGGLMYITDGEDVKTLGKK